MNDVPRDTPRVGRTWCPGCEPDVDPLEEILDVIYCDKHAPPRDGVDDDSVDTTGYFAASAEAVGSEGNTSACNLIHRRAR